MIDMRMPYVKSVRLTAAAALFLLFLLLFFLFLFLLLILCYFITVNLKIDRSYI